VVTAFSAGPIPRAVGSPFRAEVAREGRWEKQAAVILALSRALERKEPAPHALREPLVERFGADRRGIGPDAAMAVQDLDANLVGKCLRLFGNCGDPREGLRADVARELGAVDRAHFPRWIHPAPTRKGGTSDGRRLAPA